MRSLWFVITFIQIVIKGCMESPAIRTVLVILTSIAAIIFIPYWVGLLVMIYTPAGPAWPAGMMVIVAVALVVLITVMLYLAVYNAMKERMR